MWFVLRWMVREEVVRTIKVPRLSGFSIHWQSHTRDQANQRKEVWAFLP